ncbi:MAG: hypothetical protein IKN29_04130 [Bacteroidales bacterium]|nr:hypothetical protein [Bacteroidales bacterium]
MLQQEFEKLTGVEITPEQYEVINGMYMCSDNQTKQEFCKNFMEMGLMAHVNYVTRLKSEHQTLKFEKCKVDNQLIMWRDLYYQAEKRAVVLETRIKVIAEMVKGGEE